MEQLPIIDLPLIDFVPRDYQRKLFDAITHQDLYGRHKFLAVWPRRAGKDKFGWACAIWQAMIKPCLVVYCLPTFTQARKVIFDGIDIESKSFLSMIPSSAIAKINQAEMKIVFTNGSVLQLVGALNYNTALVGTNPSCIIFSEAALMENLAVIYNYVRPILAANGGWILIQSTPRGKNSFFQLYSVASELDDWYISKMGIDETKHIPADVLAQEKAQVSPDFFEQEYNVSFDKGIEGSVYGRVLDRARLEERLTIVPWNPAELVYVAIDIGIKDATTMIFYQCNESQTIVKVIDCYANRGVGLDHYTQILQSKPYRYGKFFAPHDLQVREWGGGAVTRYEKARQLDINFTILDQVKVEDGIDDVLVNFPRLYFDAVKCKSLIDALENYRREWVEEKQIYSKPIHNWASDYADAMRYLCQSLPKAKQGMTSLDFDREKAKALYGNGPAGLLPRFFQEEPAYNRRPNRF